jgi:hypothetical protein
VSAETNTIVSVSTLLEAARHADISMTEAVLRERLRRCFALLMRAFPFELSIRLMTSRHSTDSELERELLPPMCAEIMSRWLCGNESDCGIDAAQNIPETADLLSAILNALDDRLFTFFKGPDFANLSNRERNLIAYQATVTAIATFLTETSLIELSQLSMRWNVHCAGAKTPGCHEWFRPIPTANLTTDPFGGNDAEKANTLWLFMQNNEVSSRLMHAYQLASQG